METLMRIIFFRHFTMSTLIVALSACGGNSSPNVAPPPITQPQVVPQATAAPITFDFDPVNRRIVGLAGQKLIDLDLVEGEAYQYELPGGHIPVEGCHKRDTDEFIYFTYELVEDYNIKSNNLEDNDTEENGGEEILNYQYEFWRLPLSSDEAPSMFYTQPESLRGHNLPLLCHPSENRVYVAMNHYDSSTEEHSGYSAIYALNTIGASDEPWTPLFEGERWTAGGITFAEATLSRNHILIYADDQEPDRLYGLYSISLDNGELDVIDRDYFAFGTSLAQGSTPEKLYAIHYDGVDIVEPPSSTTRIPLKDNDQDFLHFHQIWSSALDVEYNRVLVSDSGLDIIIGIDLSTGTKEAVFAPGRGDGPRMVMAQGLAMDSNHSIAYVLDAGGNAPAKLLSVDLANGDRNVITKLGSPRSPHIANGLALDERSNVIYIAVDYQIYGVDIATGEPKPVLTAPSNQPEVGNIHDLVLDTHSQRLIFIASPHPDYDAEASDGVYVVDLAADRLTPTLVSKAGKRGEGAPLHTAVSIVLHPDRDVLYVGDQYAGSVYEVELGSGNRTALEIGCELPRIKEDETIQRLGLSADHNTLLLRWNGTTFIDLVTGDCIDHIYNWAVAYLPISENHFLSIESDSLYRLDMRTQRKVLISH